MLIRGLPPDSQTATLAHGSQDAQEAPESGQRHLQPVRYLEDVPVAKSMGEAMRFVNAGNDEFSSEFGREAG